MRSLAIGTDGVGSIRVPSAFCGVVGISRPSDWCRGHPDFAAVMGLLAHTGPIARTVADAALLLEAVRPTILRDAASLPLPSRSFDATPVKLDGVRIGSSADSAMPRWRPTFARRSSRRSRRSVRSGPASFAMRSFEPDM